MEVDNDVNCCRPMTTNQGETREEKLTNNLRKPLAPHSPAVHIVNYCAINGKSNSN